MRQAELTAEILAIAEQSYDRLEGEWHDWLEVAKLYEVKVPYQDRPDIRHDIIIELARARARDGKPIPILRAYRIASLTVALYWREVNKAAVKVCLYDGLPKQPNCASCKHKPKKGQCPYLALRPIQSLDSEVEGEESESVRLIETVADDHAIEAIDIDNRVDASRWLLGCPMRLIQIANKRLKGEPLDNKDRCYLRRFRQQQQKRLF